MAHQMHRQLHDPSDNGGDQFRDLDDHEHDQARKAAHGIDHLEIIEQPDQQSDHDELAVSAIRTCCSLLAAWSRSEAEGFKMRGWR